ncbi:hypothetical protein B296_00058297 [Ensete ventricosum]|uniref:Uncharacterized protein n=1 Tax=Ensete ventricosum TaxID=4639 RepID=A0A426XC14_ENSVE|nr:hypothetical protein B296_00058297 [Ensete ventricosum]
MGAGVLPSKTEAEGEMAYVRAGFEHVIGSRDSETLYMTGPDDGNGPDLTIFFLELTFYRYVYSCEIFFYPDSIELGVMLKLILESIAEDVHASSVASKKDADEQVRKLKNHLVATQYETYL